MESRVFDMVDISKIIEKVRRCKFSEIEHFNGRAPVNQSHIYEGKIPIYWFLFEDNRYVVGCYGLLPIGKEIRLRGWFVDEKYRNQGIGYELVKSAIIEAKKLGFKIFEVKTSQKKLMNKLNITPTGKAYSSFGGAQYKLEL